MSASIPVMPQAGLPPGIPSIPGDRVEQISQLALDFARELMTPEEACIRNGFTEQEARQLLANQAFQLLMQNIKSEWLDSTNAASRAMVRAGVALEDGIAQLYRLMHGQGGGPDGKISSVQVEAVKALARIAGVGVGSGSGGGAVGPAGGSVGPVFKLVINLGKAERVIEGGVYPDLDQELDIPVPLDELTQEDDD